MWAAERGSGRPVILLHGQPGLGADFEAVADLLAGDHRVVSPDRPGYGRSGSTTTSIAGNADEVADLIAELGAGPATVVGHSYGGGVAILLGARHPETVAALVLVASIGTAESLGAFDRLMAMPVVGDAVTMTGILAMGSLMATVGTRARRSGGRIGSYVGATLPDAQFARLNMGRARQVWRSVAAEQRTLLSEADAVERALSTLHLPVEVVAGEWDVMIPAKASAALAAVVPGANLSVVERVGHFVPRDAPAEVANAVRRAEARAASAGSVE